MRRRIITTLVSLAVAACLLVATGASAADATSKLNREVTSAKKTAMKELEGFDEVRWQWVTVGNKRYGKQYVGLMQYSAEDGEHTLVQPVFVPTYRLDEPMRGEGKKKQRRKVTIKFQEDGKKAEPYSAWRKTAAYAPPAHGPDYGTTAWVSVVIKLPGDDAKTKKRINANQLS